MAASRRSRSRSQTRSPARRSMSRSPRRSISPRSGSRSRSRSPTPRGPRDGHGHGRSGSHSRSRRSDSPPRSSKIVVEKLTKNVSEAHLREIFGTYGPVKSIDVPLNRQFMTNRGTAYILYEHMQDAEAAVANMHEGQVDGAVINVSVVLPRRKFSRSPPPSRRLASHLDRIPPRAYGGPPMRGGRFRSPPRRGGRGGNDASTYRPRSYTRSRSPMRSKSRSYTRSMSRSPPPRSRGGGESSYRQRDSPPPRSRRRSPSYSSYDSYSDRGRSRSRSRSPPRGGRNWR